MGMNMKKHLFVVPALGGATTQTAIATTERPITIAERAKGAETVVVATVIEVTPAFEHNEFGDRLIVSHALLRVEETLKGSPPAIMPLDVEGGTIGALTLKVSDM